MVKVSNFSNRKKVKLLEIAKLETEQEKSRMDY